MLDDRNDSNTAVDLLVALGCCVSSTKISYYGTASSAAAFILDSDRVRGCFPTRCTLLATARASVEASMAAPGDGDQAAGSASSDASSSD